MIYIDSDGVLSDFEGWIKTTNCKDRFDPKEVCITMRDYQDRAFIDAKPKKTFLWKTLKYPYAKVLTALPEKDQFITFFDSVEDYDKCAQKMTENKYKWFEKYGISRDKVIVVATRKEKFAYCKEGDILFDDYEKTVKEWSKMGGKGILVKNTESKAQQDFSFIKKLILDIKMLYYRLIYV